MLSVRARPVRRSCTCLPVLLLDVSVRGLHLLITVLQSHGVTEIVQLAMTDNDDNSWTAADNQARTARSVPHNNYVCEHCSRLSAKAHSAKVAQAASMTISHPVFHNVGDSSLWAWQTMQPSVATQLLA